MINAPCFDELHLAVLDAAIDRIIPPDDYPGAKEAGTSEFIVRLLESDDTSHFTLYESGLLSLNTEAKTCYNSNFTLLTPQQQDDILQKIERGEVQSKWQVDPKEFFSTMVRHTAEGFYSDAGNGGNKDELSWKMIGFIT